MVWSAAPMQPRRRKSKAVSLVLTTVLPVLPGCGGGETYEPSEDTVEIVEQDCPPGDESTDLVMGPLFLAWWDVTHPPRLVRRSLAQATTTADPTQPVYSGYYGRRYAYGHPFYYHTWPWVSTPRPSRPSFSPSVPRGGFGSIGHGVSGLS
jgi:hypothetical protein